MLDNAGRSMFHTKCTIHLAVSVRHHQHLLPVVHNFLMINWLSGVNLFKKKQRLYSRSRYVMHSGMHSFPVLLFSMQLDLQFICFSQSYSVLRKMHSGSCMTKNQLFRFEGSPMSPCFRYQRMSNIGSYLCQ